MKTPISHRPGEVRILAEQANYVMVPFALGGLLLVRLVRVHGFQDHACICGYTGPRANHVCAYACASACQCWPVLTRGIPSLFKTSQNAFGFVFPSGLLCLKLFWSYLEATLSHLGAILGPSWGVLEPSWGHLGTILGCLGAILGSSWGFLGQSPP